MQGTGTRKRGSSPCCSRFAAAGGLMLGFPFRGPPLNAATRHQWGTPPLQAQHFRRVSLCAVPCIAPQFWGGSPKTPAPPSRYAAFPPSPARRRVSSGCVNRCRRSSSTVVVGCPPSFAGAVPAKKTRFRYAPLRFFAGTAFLLLLSVRPPSSSFPSSVLAVDAPTTPAAVPRFKSLRYVKIKSLQG